MIVSNTLVYDTTMSDVTHIRSRTQVGFTYITRMLLAILQRPKDLTRPAGINIDRKCVNLGIPEDETH